MVFIFPIEINFRPYFDDFVYQISAWNLEYHQWEL